MPNREIKLKPCPFCGGPAEIVNTGRSVLNTYFVGCWWCGVRTDYEHDEEIAVDLWNRRVESNDH